MRCKARRPSPEVGSPAEGGPRSGPPFASSSLTRALVESERRALVVAAELEAAELRRRLRVVADVDLLERAAELAHLLDRGVDVVDGEEQIRARARVAAVHAARHGARDHEANDNSPAITPSPFVSSHPISRTMRDHPEHDPCAPPQPTIGC